MIRVFAISICSVSAYALNDTVEGLPNEHIEMETHDERPSGVGACSKKKK